MPQTTKMINNAKLEFKIRRLLFEVTFGNFFFVLYFNSDIEVKFE